MTGGIWGPDLKAGLDGKMWQFVDLMYVADANFNGKWDVISIENADNAKRPIAPFTDAQCDELIRVIDIMCTKEFHSNCPSNWLCHQFGIPRQMIPDTKPNRRGIGLHRQGVEHSLGFGIKGYLVKGGVKWSLAKGKDCPTDVRAKQVTDIIIPTVLKLGYLRAHASDVQTPPVAEEDEDMKLVMMLPEVDADDNDPRSLWVYNPNDGTCRRIKDPFERTMLREAGAIDMVCTEAQLSKVIPAGEQP
jgi:hypothetical protein